MTRGRRLTCRAGLLLLALAAVSPVLEPGSAVAMVGAQGASLTPPFDGRVLREGDRVLAYVRFESGAGAGADSLRAEGAKIVDVSRRYQTVTVAVKPGDLAEVAEAARVANVTPAHPPIAAAAAGSGPGTSAVTRCFGAATSEGDVQLGAMAAREGFALNGSGVTVGILSDSYNRNAAAATHAPADVASGDLPGKGNPCGFTTPVQAVDDSEAGGKDEGRAMAQIVHDLAPGADVAFATAFRGEPSFAENIGKLAGEGARVIVDDVFYPEEPFFQDGPVAVAVNEAVANGVTYLSSAGNNNLIDGAGRDIASWEAPEFRDSGGCPAAVVALSEEMEAANGPGSGLEPEHCMDFDPNGEKSDDTFGITVSKGATLAADLQWAEPWEGVGTDLDAFLLGPEGDVVEESIENNASVGGTQRPYELVEWSNDTGSAAHVQLVINRFGGGDPRLKLALLENGGGVTATEYPESSEGDAVGPTVFGHSGAASAIGVAAAPYFSDDIPEAYSSRGPLTHYFGPVTGPAPAAPLGSPELIAKPDLTATDGGANTFFGSCEAHTWRFFGTSAAAPHAAAVAALGLQADPTATPEELREALTESASPMGAFAPEAVGTGLVDAPEAIAALTSVPFPGGAPFAPPAPQNCDLPRAPESNPLPTNPLPPSPPAGEGPVTTETKHRRPRTLFLQRPERTLRTHGRGARVVMRFGSDETDVSYICRIDGGLFRPCPERLARRFEVGTHAVLAVARDADGFADRTPAVARFRVKRVG
jgi:Subtilase family